MRYFIIGNDKTKVDDTVLVAKWLEDNGHTVINPFICHFDGITDTEQQVIRLALLSLADGVLCLNKQCNQLELLMAKRLGKKVKYLSKQWKLKAKKSNKIIDEVLASVYGEENNA